MNGHGKSDRPIVPKKPPNKGSPYGLFAEGVEGRGLAKENPLQQNPPTGHRADTDGQNALERIRQAAKQDKDVRFTALWHHVANVHRLREEYFALKHSSAPGVDGQTWEQYGQNLEGNLRDLSGRLHRGVYHAKPVKRAWIPKPDGRQRPIGIADRRVVRHIKKWLNAGVLDEGKRIQVEEGTPQGGNISPLLANIYLHYVFDLWAHQWRKTRTGGDVVIPGCPDLASCTLTRIDACA